ncbi:uncharacterized protein TRAVEDRAFT_125848 [Trametes versicolor FP-101664 SS1]|uniref:uncharacterized protein n=1 Tax=Trametes versicolor (strain FP-101664) TaxID=717944 RepID=UPI0004623B8B|nr:uncharacterized protein TRAVEDRAFT_125848 [Trametes versicolor FP-101664 SS1]EIW57399.1 hypothetical protein TRAVEDRAFT_125848 [Trametes versicolor FP-101664 SS1]
MNGIIVAGIIVAAVIGLGAFTWLGIRWYRKRAADKRAARRGSAFANFSPEGEKGSASSAGPPVQGSTFSRDQLHPGVVMPDKAVLRPDASREEIIEHYSSAGALPRPFAPFAPRASMDGGDAEGAGADFTSSGRPMSTASWLPPGLLAGNRGSRISIMSTNSSIGGASGTTQKKVRQVFDPVLPDELVIALGQSLTIVQEFDDGWCIVGRDSMFKPGEVELGAVPAWCFHKAVKGLRGERPMRISSLGVTVDLDAPTPAFGQRENVMSWSNF